MPRYMVQRDMAPTDVSCGPIAIMNALKKFGYRLNTKHLSHYRKLCKYQRHIGVFQDDFYGALVALNHNSLVIDAEHRCPSAKEIGRFLKYNPSGAVVLCCRPTQMRHACTVVEISRSGRYLLVTNGKWNANAWFPIREVQRWIRRDEQAIAYFLLPRQQGWKRGKV
jgi:hypothetical protein